jgi:ParB family chromosome partitioning protein
MTDTTSIPLNKLVAWKGNVRKTPSSDESLSELAASIHAVGLINPLTVRPAKKGKFEVGAGGRRLAALQLLASEGKIEADHPVRCEVRSKDDDFLEVSLAENTVREQMHPADEFDAFLALIESGKDEADVAARFGVTETVVKQRLKLARVSPRIMAAYREDYLSLAQVMAFAVSDDHAAQENVLENLSDYDRDPSTIRDALTEHEVAATDRRVRFVTVDNYQTAGGGVRRDLFATGDSGVFILNTDLLDRLVLTALENERVKIAAEGWKWVEARIAFDHSEWSACRRVYAEPVPLTPEEDAELTVLRNEYDQLYELDELDQQQGARFDELGYRIDALEERETVYSPETKAIAGAVVCINHDGEIDVKRGFVRPEDAPKKTRNTTTANGGENGAAKPKPALPFELTENLTAQRSAAISAALCERPDVALAALVYTLTRQTLCGGYARESSLDVTAAGRSFRRVEGAKALEAIERHKENWGARIPADEDAAWKWFLAQHSDTLIDLLAVCVALTVNTVQEKKDRPDCERLVHGHLLASALGLDMNDWFVPTAENFFSKISKPQILTALQEARTNVAPAWSNLKKTELASLAERETAGTGWLPEILRKAA